MRLSRSLCLPIALTLFACSTTPSFTRTAVVKDIMVAEDVSPQSLLIHTGDEVRWVNTRKDEIQIDLPRLATNQLACQRGFSNWLGQTRESVHLEPNETASICFSNPTVLHYVVRANSELSGGKQLMAGSVRITDGR